LGAEQGRATGSAGHLHQAACRRRCGGGCANADSFLRVQLSPHYCLIQALRGCAGSGLVRPLALRRRCCGGCVDADFHSASMSALLMIHAPSVLCRAGPGSHLLVDAAAAAVALTLTYFHCVSQSALFMIHALWVLCRLRPVSHLHVDAAAAAVALMLSHFARASQLCSRFMHRGCFAGSG